MSFTISLSTDRKMAIFSLRGYFDMPQGFALWQYSQPEINHFQTYIFDLKEVKDIRDSGLGLLMAFLKQAKQDGAEVRMINADTKIKQRCRVAGIDVEERMPVRYCIAHLHNEVYAHA